MPGRYVRKGVIRRTLNSLDRGRIPLPGWLRDCLTLWALAAALYALVWPLSNTPVAPLLAAAAVVLALVGLWISAVNVFELYKSAREQLAVRKDYARGSAATARCRSAATPSSIRCATIWAKPS